MATLGLARTARDDELTESRENHSRECSAPPLASIRSLASGNLGPAHREHALYSDEDDLLNRPEQNDFSESKTSFRSQGKLVTGAGLVAALGVCACAYFLLPSSNDKTASQPAEASAAVEPVPASPVQIAQNGSQSIGAAASTPARSAEPVDASAKVAAAALPTTTEPPKRAPARTEDILFLQRPGVNIRSTPSTSGSAVGTAPKGTRFKVTSREADWVQVQNGRLKGWINAQFLGATEPR
jgi:hypothetical protein